MSLFSAWGPVLVWATLIFYLSSIPSLNTGWGLWDFALRKIAHMTEFGMLFFLLARAMRKTVTGWGCNRLLMWSGSLAFLYAISDELHQSFVPGRTPSIGDVLIDGCGIILAVLIYKNREKCEKF